MTRKQSYITPITIRTNSFLLNPHSNRSLLTNDQRISNMDNDRYLISDYAYSNNLGKFYKTRYADLFGFLNIPVQYPEEDF